jgi:hypothetical protein
MLVAAFWLLATQHCGLEAIGFGFDSNHDLAHCASGEDIDGCKTVEEGGFKSMGNALSAPAPDLTICLLLIYASFVPATAPDDASVMPADFVEHPRAWVPTWQFVQRAALSPRAPTLSLA